MSNWFDPTKAKWYHKIWLYPFIVVGSFTYNVFQWLKRKVK
ncbi:hypothetical protein P4V41_07580 [Fictibacillus nanhaiensis]|nr:hypothetical protein [Fictibacillus nanhaiensis]